MGRLLRFFCVLLIAAGVGMFVQGSYLADLPPSKDASSESSDFFKQGIMRDIALEQRRDRAISAGYRGWGAGLFVLGALGLVLPMITACKKKRTSGNSESSPPEKPRS